MSTTAPIPLPPSLHALAARRAPRPLDRFEVESETRAAAYAFGCLEQLRLELRDEDCDDVTRARTLGRYLYWTDKLSDFGALDFLRREIEWDRADARRT